MKAALIVLAPLLLGATSAQQTGQANIPAYADREDLNQAVRCTLIKFVKDAAKRNVFVEGTKATARYRNETERVRGFSASIPLSSFVSLELSASSTQTRTNSVTATAGLGVLPSDPLTDVCRKWTIKTLDARGRPGPRLPGILFTADDILGPPGGTINLTDSLEFEQKFTRTKREGGILKAVGDLIFGSTPSNTATFESGYTALICFKVGGMNAGGIQRHPGLGGNEKCSKKGLPAT